MRSLRCRSSAIWLAAQRSRLPLAECQSAAVRGLCTAPPALLGRRGLLIGSLFFSAAEELLEEVLVLGGVGLRGGRSIRIVELVAESLRAFTHV